MQAIDRVLLARDRNRATAAMYIPKLFTDFVELHGDRRYGDDQAIVAGIARLNGRPVTVVAIEKGEDTTTRVARNFGSAHPEGYRKALRQFAQAEKFHRPVITLIDTAGAFCGLGAEERGQGQAIAESLMTLSALKTPVLAVLTGEGGSGGALALAVADRVWMLTNAVYSVISPEGCASILWKDASRTQEAAESLKLTADDLLAMRVIEQVIPEQDTLESTCQVLQQELIRELDSLCALPLDELLSDRYARFRCMGGVLP